MECGSVKTTEVMWVPAIYLRHMEMPQLVNETSTTTYNYKSIAPPPTRPAFPAQPPNSLPFSAVSPARPQVACGRGVFQYLLMNQGNSRQIQLTETLIKKNTDEAAPAFKGKIDAQWLKSLFEPDNIKDRVSNRDIEKVGGYAGLEETLKTNLQEGISGAEGDKKERIRKYGRNDPLVKQPKTLWDMVMENFEDQTILILCFAAGASLVLGVATHGWAEGWLEGVSILLAVAIITVVTAGNNYMKEQQFRKLSEVAAKKDVNVTRNGQVQHMSVYELLVGDIVQIETGEILSVDGMVVKANRLSIDESSMTGESKTITKEAFEAGTNKNCFLISGTRVLEGTGMMLVLCVGKCTQENILKAKLQQEDDQTPLQEKLADLADQIGKLGMYSAAFTFAALVVHLLIDTFHGKHALFSMEFIDDMVEYFIIAVSIVVIAVPEGLPLAVTISLAYSVGKMREEKNLVRFLSACETMGGANNICSDKTGTLTKNLMTVTRFWGQGAMLEKFDSHDKTLSDNFKTLLASAIALNSDANPKVKRGSFEQVGNKTECALLEMVYNYGFDYREVRKTEDVINQVPFSSDRKRMSAICRLRKNNKYYIFSKGAPEILVNYCSKFLDKNNEVTAINERFRAELDDTITKFASQSLRTLLLCYQELPNKDIAYTPDPEKLEKDLIILGLAGIKDPLKDSVPEAVLNCKKAGIIVRMVTGDNTETATAIAKDAHIISSDYVRPAKGEPGYYIVMEGREFRTLVEGLVKKNQEEDKEEVRNIEAFREITDELRVLARSSPEDKYILATGLKQLGNVVAMTGDGTNDAPALKKADIGFAMGIAGTQVAKEAAGIILLDDNFSSIITAVKYGRNIFDCIRKFLQFQLTVNIVAIFMAFLGAVVIKESPLTPIQMLWVNLIMDTLAALALATEPPSNDLLNRMPYSRTEHIINSQMWRGIVLSSIYQILVLVIVLFRGDQLFGVASSVGLTMQEWNETSGQHLSIFFDVFVFLQVFNFFNARKLKKEEVNVFENFFDNYLFIFIVAGIFVLQIIIVQVGGRAFMLVPLSMGQHFDCIVVGATIIVYGFIAKKLVPESFLNNFDLLKEGEPIPPYDPDSIFERYKNRPATERRESRHRREKERERDAQR